MDCMRGALRLPEFPGRAALQVCRCDQTEPGGCLVELPGDQIDGRVSSQLAALAEHLGADEASE